MQFCVKYILFLIEKFRFWFCIVLVLRSAKSFFHKCMLFRPKFALAVFSASFNLTSLQNQSIVDYVKCFPINSLQQIRTFYLLYEYYLAFLCGHFIDSCKYDGELMHSCCNKRLLGRISKMWPISNSSAAIHAAASYFVFLPTTWAQL